LLKKGEIRVGGGGGGEGRGGRGEGGGVGKRKDNDLNCTEYSTIEYLIVPDQWSTLQWISLW